MPIIGGRQIGVRGLGFQGAGKPSAPTSVTATDVGTGRAYNNGAATVSFTPGSDNGAPVSTYTVTSSPGGYTNTGSSSPITVTGLQSNTSYTFTVTATNAVGTSDAGTSNIITATTVPQTPTITSATRSSNTAVSISFSGATGGKSLTAVTATSSPSVSITSSGTSSPMTATATYVQGTSYTFTITATNANGTSSASAASGAVTPYPIPSVGSWSTSTAYPAARNATMGQGNGTWVVSAGGNTASTFATAVSYYWSGSAWTDTFLGTARSYTTMAATNDGRFYALGGYTAGSGLISNVEYKTAGNQPWGTATQMPAADAEGGGAGIGSGVLYINNGQNVSLTTRWLPSATGVWTTGTVMPATGAQGGTHNSDWSKAFIPRGGEVIWYSIPAYNGSWTTETNMPATYTSGSLLNPNQNCIWMSGGNFNSNTYRYFNNTWTAQTAAPVYFAVGRAGGIRSNTWSLFSNRQNGTDYSQGHYTATIS